ncbi:MAG: aldo/keto reductase [Acidobacteria bacterium]|nr:aldo/keto reductase [Acidobacteriota bacterium]
MVPTAHSAPRTPLGNTGLECHPLGFGCYRVIEGNQTHEAALREYLNRGGNLIDTSANYGDGRSELMVGNLLKEFPEDQAIVVTKGGYIQGQNLALAMKQEFPEVVAYGEGIWHSIHPEFLETQVRSSAQRLRRNTIDAYLLHNPEYYLEDAAHKGNVTEKHHKEFYRRIGEAFRFLEAKVKTGEIRWYGISSNNFGMAVSSPTMTSIERCWQAAESISAQHHFRVAQLPLNIYESGGALEANNNGRTALEFCREHAIGVLINRPLNAFFANRMVRLADFRKPGEKPGGREGLQSALAPLRSLETELREQFDIPLLYSTPGGIAEYLEFMIPQISSAAHWEKAFHPYVIQPIEKWAVECQQLYGNREEWRAWWQRFTAMFPSVLDQMARHVAGAQQGVSDEVRAQLKLSGYPANNSSLSQLALSLITQLDGVSSVLVGMRRPEYVEDSFGATELASVDARSILSRFRSMNS